MDRRQIGSSGLRVTPVGLGCNNFGWTIGQQESNEVVARALDLGVNLFDTADRYGATGGDSEVVLGKALGQRRDEIVLLTKFGVDLQNARIRDSSRRYVLRAAEASLKRLGTDYIDIYMIHWPDYSTPIEETLRALDDLVRSGKVRYIGCSNFAAWELMKALGISERNAWARFDAVESQWSIATRELERELLPLARSEGVGVLAWAPLLGGVLSGKYQRDRSSDQPGRHGGKVSPLLDHDKVHDIVDAMREIAAAHAVTPAEIALAFLLREPATASVIFGSTRPEQVKANLKASGLQLSAAEIERLDLLSAIKPDYGMSIVANGRKAREQYR